MKQKTGVQRRPTLVQLVFNLGMQPALDPGIRKARALCGPAL